VTEPRSCSSTGGSNAGSSWARLAVRLSGFRCLLVDRPGCGLSVPLRGRLDADGMQHVARTQLADLLDARELHSSQVIATSYDELTALLSAAAHPDRIDRSVAVPVGRGRSLRGRADRPATGGPYPGVASRSSWIASSRTSSRHSRVSSSPRPPASTSWRCSLSRSASRTSSSESFPNTGSSRCARGLEPRPVWGVIEEPREPVDCLVGERHPPSPTTQRRASASLDLPEAGVGLGQQRCGVALPVDHQPCPEAARRQPVDGHPHPPRLWTTTLRAPTDSSRRGFAALWTAAQAEAQNHEIRPPRGYWKAEFVKRAGRDSNPRPPDP
jgi:pimeloyl-ACP methyl ester carboxylesterase